MTNEKSVIINNKISIILYDQTIYGVLLCNKYQRPKQDVYMSIILHRQRQGPVGLWVFVLEPQVAFTGVIMACVLELLCEISFSPSSRPPPDIVYYWSKESTREINVFVGICVRLFIVVTFHHHINFSHSNVTPTSILLQNRILKNNTVSNEIFHNLQLIYFLSKIGIIHNLHTPD